MRVLPIIAGVLGLIVVLSEISWVGRTSLWLPLMCLAVAVVLLAASQVRHGG